MGTTSVQIDANPGLRSRRWFEGDGLSALRNRAWFRSEGFPGAMFDGRPVIGVINSWAEVTPCNSNLRPLADHVKRGIVREGGFPIEAPAMSLSEPIMKPTTMFYRNLMAMEVEETIKSYPFDAVVLLSGCDKTTPAMLLAAASSDIPAIVVTSGPMLKGMKGMDEIGGRLTAADTDYRAGRISESEWLAFEPCVGRSSGHCGIMGTASTMAIITEALGMSLSGAASIPAPDARRRVLAEETGARAVALAWEQLLPSDVMTADAFRNAITALMAVGGSTNAVVHLLALSRRTETELTLDDFERISRRTPLLVDVLPVGTRQMEDFFYAGGLPAVLTELSPLLELGAITVTGRTLGEELDGAVNDGPEVIRSMDGPLRFEGGIAVLRGNLCPDGAVIKHAAGAPHLREHTGRAVVFTNKDDLERRIHDPDLDVDESSVLVLQNAGPIGGPGMPEWGMLPIPEKLARDGVRDMVRISDARMSGMSYGTCVLHVAPEAAVGGPLGLVRDGDSITLDVAGRTLTLHVEEHELEARRVDAPSAARDVRGYEWLYVKHVMQADAGVDFDFMAGSSSAHVPMYRPAETGKSRS